MEIKRDMSEESVTDWRQPYLYMTGGVHKSKNPYLVFTRTFVPGLAVSLKVTDGPTRFQFSSPKWERIYALRNIERN